MPRQASLRPRSRSCHHLPPSSHRFDCLRVIPQADLDNQTPITIDSLDLSISLPSVLIYLRTFLISHLHQIEQRLRLIHPHPSLADPVATQIGSDSDLWCINSSDDEDDEDDPNDHDEGDDRLHSASSSARPLLPPNPKSPPSTPSHLDDLVHQFTSYVVQLKSELLSLPPIEPNQPFPAPFSHLPYTLAHSSVTRLKPLKHTLDCLAESWSSLDPEQLIHSFALHSQKVQELLGQLSLSCNCPGQGQISSTALSPDLGSLLQNVPSPSSLRHYFAAESDRLASLLPKFSSGFTESLAQSSSQLTSVLRACKEEAQAVLHDGEVFIRGEGEKLKDWVDSETESLRLALQAGASRLLSYHELPDEWKNNRFILNGYRFIPLDRWHHLLLSSLQWHNETINIHTHFFGTLSLVYLLWFLWPTTAHTDPASSTFTDRLISLTFVICAIKCLVCSTAWHLFAGCGTLGPFRRFACVDYVGISGLIAASVVSAEYYGFYCRPELAACYIGFTTLMGVIGMILPFQPFFDRPESKGIRIVFFVSMACSFLIPQAHMSYLYGAWETVNFYRPAIPSVISYLGGLFFYASNWPERIRPGWVFDTLFHSHQFWHVAIVIAIWLHWRAIGFLHDAGRMGFSCANDLQNGQVVSSRHRLGNWGFFSQFTGLI